MLKNEKLDILLFFHERINLIYIYLFINEIYIFIYLLMKIDIEIHTTIRKKNRDENTSEHQDDFDFAGNVSEHSMMSSQQYQADVLFDK